MDQVHPIVHYWSAKMFRWVPQEVPKVRWEIPLRAVKNDGTGGSPNLSVETVKRVRVYI